MSRNGTAPDWSALLTYGGTSKVSMSLVSRTGLGPQRAAGVVCQFGRPQREFGALVASRPERERGRVRVHVGGRLSDRDVGDLGRGQERYDRIGHDGWGSSWQVMTRARDELQASIRQGAYEAAGGIDGNHGVLRVGEDENRRLDRRDSALQLAKLAQQGALLGQECAPQRAVSAAGVAPDLPVDVLVRTHRAAAPPGDPGEPDTGD